MVVSVGISEQCRNRLGVVICVFCCLLALSGICFVGLGLFIQVHVNDQLILLESYNSGILPNFLVGIGSLMVLINLLCAKLSYDCGFADTREKFRMTLVPLLVVIFLFTWVILAAAIVCMLSRSTVEEALHDGLEDAMSRYKKNLRLKVAMDRLQMNERCCGSRAYTDWFNIGWINPEYVNEDDPYVKGNSKNGDVIIDSVPFSCCDVKVARPCVSNFVLNKTRHVGYSSPTLYMVGCTDALMDKLENKLLRPVAYFTFGIFGTQLLVFIMVRYLQTSITSAYEEGNPEGKGTGFLFPNCCASCTTGDPDKYVKAGALDRKKRGAVEEAVDNTYDVIDMDEPLVGHGDVADDFDDFGGHESEMDGNGEPGHEDAQAHQGHKAHGHQGHKSELHSPKKPKSSKLKSKLSPKKPKFLKKLKKPKFAKKTKTPKSPKKANSPKRSSKRSSKRKR